MRVAVIMGSTSDLPKVEPAIEILKKYDVKTDVRCLSAHRAHDKLVEFIKEANENGTEVIIAAKANDKKETIYEIADLAYHVMVMMVEMGISVEDIQKELASRHVIDHKVKQEKMTK
jgi:phosphoribosyl-ATP pyrophosphohydrolase/phosphoribosyl-AMP cyclohydrolase